ncbi:hypothetical protein N806_10780 [Rhodococcus sp. P27]|nr:hypothetical protein N806_10780 [Rhodococcus sp. P27]
MSAPKAPAKPAILSVDDDPGVSRAVVRDLRKRYGEKYRIIRAESGDQALETLREMKLRGDAVAVIVADYRMPGLSGIEFLEQAMDLYPVARRVLLTAYADTDAAIDAINVVDLDHYLLKPWDPPEEKLYPVIDALLDAWASSSHHPAEETKVIGHRWSERSSDVREFLARNQLAYRWYMSDEPEGQRLLSAAGTDELRLPVVIASNGDVLVEPTDAELADKLGLSTTLSEDFYDLVVIGGGPAGLGAALYGASEGLRTVLIERRATGGQAGQSSRIENYLASPTESPAHSWPIGRGARQPSSAPKSSPLATSPVWKSTARPAPCVSTTVRRSTPIRSSWRPVFPIANFRRRGSIHTLAEGSTTGQLSPKLHGAANRMCT